MEREFALVKVRGKGGLLEAMRLAEIYRARVVDATMKLFEITGSTDKVDQFVDLMHQIGLVEIGKSGIVAISRDRGELEIGLVIRRKPGHIDCGILHEWPGLRRDDDNGENKQ